jgi:hypothetical protein
LWVHKKRMLYFFMMFQSLKNAAVLIDTFIFFIGCANFSATAVE